MEGKNPREIEFKLGIKIYASRSEPQISTLRSEP